MGTKQSNLRKATRKVTSGEWELEVAEVRGALSIEINDVYRANLEGDLRRGFDLFREAYGQPLMDAKKLRQQENISDVERRWRLGEILNREGPDWTNSQYPLFTVFSEVLEYGGTTLSNANILYNVFELDEITDTGHPVTLIQLFAERPKNKQRGRDGYFRYQELDFTIPRKAIRAWCQADKEAYDEYIKQLKSEQAAGWDDNELATRLQEICHLTDDLDVPGDEKAATLVDEHA